MNVTLKNYRTLDFDVINIQEEWNKPTERENRMHCIHAYPAKFPAFITTMAIQKAEQKNIKVDILMKLYLLSRLVLLIKIISYMQMNVLNIGLMKRR